MKSTKKLKGLWNYFIWEKMTGDLCHAGKEITHTINNTFDSLESDTVISFIKKGNFLELLPDLHAPLNLRKRYWLERKPKELISKMTSYPAILKARFEQYKALGDPSSAFGIFLWLHSTIDIATCAVESGILPQEHYDRFMEKACALIEKGVEYFRTSPQNTVSSGIYHEGILESSTRYVVRHFAHNLKNIFRIVEPDQRMFFLEIFESWDFGNRKITVCAPISIGCPNRCYQCNVGTFIPYHRALTADEIFNVIYTNAIINDDVTSLFFEPEELTVYYLGGGDPGDNIGEIEKIVQKVHQFYYGEDVLAFVKWIENNNRRSTDAQSPYPFQQVVSTIGINNGSLERLVRLAREIPELGIQVSVNAFSEQARAHTIRRTEKTMSIEDCVRAAEKLYDITSGTENPRKAYLSIFLLQDVYDDPDTIVEDMKGLDIDKERCHITLDVLRHPPAQFAHKVASMHHYRRMCSRLRKEGYSVSIYCPPEDTATEEGCGVVSTYLLQKLRDQSKYSQLVAHGKRVV